MKLSIENTVWKHKEENSAEDIEMMTEVSLQGRRNRANIGMKITIKFIMIGMIKEESIIKRATI